MHLGDGHGVLVGALPSLLGVHGDAGAGPQVAVEQVVVHPWEAQALVVVQLPCCRLAAADPHCCLCFACLRRVSSVLPCPPLFLYCQEHKHDSHEYSSIHYGLG